MANRPKQKGTSWETAFVNALREDGFLAARRKVLAGGADEGDIGGITSYGEMENDTWEFIVEAKNVRSYNFPTWVDEAVVEAEHTSLKEGKPTLGAVAAKRNGKGDVRASIIAMDYHTLLRLLRLAGFE